MKTKPTDKEIYFWNLLGNLAAAGVSVIYLLIVTRLQSAEVADTYSLATSIGNLWVIIGLFQVRNYQGTDIKKNYSFNSYFLSRLITVFLMLITLLPYLYVINYDFSTFALFIVFLIVAYRMSDCFSDVFQGLYQQEGRLDLAGKYMFYRYVGSSLVLTLFLVVTKSIIIALLSLVIFNLLMVYFFDYRQSRNFDKISWNSLLKVTNFKSAFLILVACSPLFLYGFLINQIFNEPRLVIAAAQANGQFQNGIQRDFNILFMPVFFMSLCVLIVRPLITDLAKYWYEKQYKIFDRLILKIFLFLSISGLFMTGAAYFLGIPVLSLVFGVNLTQYSLTLTILVFSGILYSMAIVLENIITIFRKHSYLLIVYILMYFLSISITKQSIIENGLLGAATSFLLVMLLYVFGSVCIYIFVRYHKRKES
ncbi:lipopolysaccharide biosynthesis protein [Streptococcus massiliensis]|uniref:Polysaccharide biosynthesis protein n=1 Tax=Streptococcus massiliensis TaxID=313439 RepID=A0A380KW25_9STRE|nr:hypothetical protein [Streptococcus massiliensis]SUN75741.1 polysaccharide biosynthesis protein [Streptococcus massiliensis]